MVRVRFKADLTGLYVRPIRDGSWWRQREVAVLSPALWAIETLTKTLVRLLRGRSEGPTSTRQWMNPRCLLL